MRFEWDSQKAHSNNLKHGITFEKATTAFDDPWALLAVDERHSTSKELREWLIGEADTGVLVVVFTKREAGQVYRLISARRAHRLERRRYEDFKQFPV